ncbi:MAG: extracellular solute-binding protein [Desulfobacterales bacterium]|nr:extracellular solute-binding protein [Desulfobacterales bacterium]
MKTRVFLMVAIMATFFGTTLSRPDTRAASLREEMVVKAKAEGSLVVVGSNASLLRTGLDGFRRRYPFIKITDLAMNTGSTVNRVSLEAKAGRLTIDWAGISEDGSEVLVRRGLNAKLDFPHLKDFEPGSQPPHGLYVGGAANPRIQGVYNTDLVSPQEVPKSWEDIGDPKWKGKTMISRSSEEFPGRLAWFWRDRTGNWNWDRAFELFRKIKAQDPVIGRGMYGGGQSVAAGEVAIFWFAVPSSVAQLAVQRGAPIGLIAFPKFFGALRAWNIFKNAPHPAAAWLFTDYLISPEGQFEFSDKVGAYLPLNRKAKLGSLAQWADNLGASVKNMVLLDLAKLEEIYDPAAQKKSQEFFFQLMGLR